MSARFTLDQIAKMRPELQAQVAAQMQTCHPMQAEQYAPSPSPAAKSPGKPRIRQNSAGLNKTEQAFFEFLQRGNPHRIHLAQSITLKIANGCRYTPDFITVCDCGSGTEMPEHPQVSQIRAYETKGFFRDDAAVKLKVAATAYPWIKFHLVTRKKGEWIIQEILP